MEQWRNRHGSNGETDMENRHGERDGEDEMYGKSNMWKLTLPHVK